MKITSVRLSIWITLENGGKQFNDCNEVEKLCREITDLIKERGYYIPDEYVGKNPSLSIFKS